MKAARLGLLSRGANGTVHYSGFQTTRFLTSFVDLDRKIAFAALAAVRGGVRGEQMIGPATLGRLRRGANKLTLDGESYRALPLGPNSRAETYFPGSFVMRRLISL